MGQEAATVTSLLLSFFYLELTCFIFMNGYDQQKH